MDFWFEKTTPANTAKVDALEEEIKLSAGTIEQVWIFHPAGCAGLAYATITEGIHQLYPTNPKEAYHGDGIPFIFPDDHKLKKPALLKLKTWNLDDTYDHYVYIRITVLLKKPDPFQTMLIDLVKILKRMMGID